MATDEYLYHRRLIIGLTTVILMLAVASYALRLYARRISGARIWLDDCVIGVGLLLSCIPCICNYVGLRYGFGKHAAEVSAQDLETYLKYVFAQQMAWVWMMPTIKVAILLLYYRLFPNKTFRRVIYGMGTNMRPGLWSTAEGGIGVMSANLPSLRPLFSRTAGVKPRSGPSVPSSGKNDMHNASGSLSMQGFCSGSKAFEQVGDSHSCHSFADAVNEAAPMQVTWNETHLETEIPLKCITVTTDIEQKIESQRDD
ncbi:MAG: hypothetical protein LQ347_004059 [Umbilicaria vellea]|nr:MAG: hypothetical protein LQ347_004059 [Umbilicaria vellea]